MNDILENEQKEKTIKSINLDDFSIIELLEYIENLNVEIERVEKEIEKKKKIQEDAKKYF